MSSEKIISEATPIRIGLVVGFLAVFATGIWWAATINGKLDFIVSNQQAANSSIAELKASAIAQEKGQNDLNLRVTILESKNPDVKK